MDFLEDTLPLDLPLANSSIIKVIGVGGGGGNAVNHMYKQGIADVSFVVCNTDNQDLVRSPVPIKVQLGKSITQGLGAGGRPEIARQAAEESVEDIHKMLADNTKMVFITAGMGGGTGTGASPIVAKTAHDMGILTVGIVTIPFAFEGNLKIRQALEGVVALSEYVDAILVINNEKLKNIYPDLNLSNAFAKADDVLTNAAKAIAEIITISGYINIDFADVSTIMRDGKVAIMNTGYASGENRITRAIEDALTSPLLNTNDVKGAKKVLLSLYCSHSNEIKMEEITQIHEFMAKVGENVTVIWGASFDDELGDEVKMTLIATGFDVKDIPGMPSGLIKKRKTVEEKKENAIEVIEEPVSEEELEFNKKSSEEEFNKAMGELYGPSLRQIKTEKKEEVIQEILQFEAAPEDKLPVVNIFELESEEDLNQVEQVPAWKRRFMKK
ncbi:MAG TPA: cell division protein FtsZ [Paludibacteraceae bacterium]|mgnify:CR=1 FL=1|nr:cell division protein FtsZ [Paludibacteraceae bacterium]HPT43150.1 cell division protein FtsZ [Paludibacteraceae bacterium]